MANFDELRKHRQQAERDAAFPDGPNNTDPNYLAARQTLALFYLAEQLYLLRENFAAWEDSRGDRS